MLQNNDMLYHLSNPKKNTSFFGMRRPPLLDFLNQIPPPQKKNNLFVVRCYEILVFANPHCLTRGERTHAHEKTLNPVCGWAFKVVSVVGPSPGIENVCPERTQKHNC